MYSRTIFLIILLSIAPITLVKGATTHTFTALSHTLGSILEYDNTALQFGYTGKLLERFDIYRAGILDKGRKVSPLIPTVWSVRPTLDTTHLYTPYIQKYPLSCEIASVRMIMESYGRRQSEESIFRAIPHHVGELSGGIWGNPDVEFVGSLTGTQGGRTGYGIYEAPLAEYLQNQGYETEIVNIYSYTGSFTPHRHLLSLLDKIRLGSRVILWGDWCTNTEDEDGLLGSGGRWILRFFPIAGKNECARPSDERQFTWKTESGKEISAISGEHTFILLGYMGTPDWITHIIVWDTYTGRHIFSYEEWMRKWNLMDYRSLTVSER